MTDVKRYPAKVLRYAHYVTDDQNAPVSTYHDFCGQCLCELKNAFDSPIRPEHVDDPFSLNRERMYRRISFCPWCGTPIDANCWQGLKVLNLRNPDHFQDPGSHVGDKHEFENMSPAGHVLGGELCWCDPVVTPHSDGCVISHKDTKQIKAAPTAARRPSRRLRADKTNKSASAVTGFNVLYHYESCFGSSSDIAENPD